MEVELISITPDCEKVIEEAGRTCYKSVGNKPEIIQGWIKAGHESVIEHASATFRISGVSRALTHQLVRHRIASFSQESQRYVNQDNAEFVVPDDIAANDECIKIYGELLNHIGKSYKRLIDIGIKKENARYILPNATCTEIVVTMNFRSLRNFFELRCDYHAQWEIRAMAFSMLTIMKQKAPNVFFDMEVL